VERTGPGAMWPTTEEDASSSENVVHTVESISPLLPPPPSFLNLAHLFWIFYRFLSAHR
jgi:hypothetical protein